MIAAHWSLKQKFEHQGQSIAYDVLGEGDPIVLAHGTPFSSYVWRTNARELARGSSLVAIPNRDFGSSPSSELSFKILPVE